MSAIRYPKPSILEELSPARHAVIEASAGTGKTYTLKHLVIELLLSDAEVALENVLVVTFTRRATSDLKRQVRSILNEVLAAFGDGRDLCGPHTPHWRIDEDGAGRLRAAMLGFDRAEIYTIHSFCQKLLTENAFQNSQLFELELVDEDALFRDCFEDVLRGRLSTDADLSKWLEAWLMPTVDGGPDNLRKKLFEAYSSTGQLRRPTGDPSAEALLEKARAKAAQDKSLSTKDKYNLQTAILQRCLEPVVAEMQRRKQRDGLYCYSDMLSLVARSLRRADAGDASCKAFRELVRKQYRYALIDEFQDTDPEQWEIFRRLFVDGGDEHRIYIIGDPKQAIYRFRGADVWTYLRAADYVERRGDLARLQHNFRSTHEMVAAYNAVLAQHTGDEPFFTNAHINYENPVRPNPVARRRVRRRADRAAPKAITAMRVDVPKGRKDDVAPRWLDWMATEIESILWGDGRLEVAAAEDDQWRPVDAGDIFVLTNSNAEARQVGELLRQRGIPYAFYRQEGLFQTHEATDVATLLRGIAEPGAATCRRAAYRTPFFAVPIRHLAEFDEQTSIGQLAHQTLLDWHEIAQRRQFARLFRKVLDDSGIVRRELLVGDGERALSNYQQIFEALTQRAASGGDDLAGLIDWLRGRIDGDEQAGGRGSDGDEDENIQRLETDRPAVQLMTMHKSKGLEAEVVFIYGGFSTSNFGLPTLIDHDDPTDPSAERATFVSSSKSFLTTDQKRRLEEQNGWESERLMYVALTRAKSRLYLCYASAETKYGRGGRHEALVRSLDRLYTDNPEPEHLEFVDIGKPGSHPETAPTADVDPRDWLKAPALLDRFDRALEEAEPARSYADIRAASRESVSFSGVRAYQGGERIELRELDDEDTTDPTAADELGWDDMVRGDRFDADVAVLGGGTAPGSFLHDILERLDDRAYRSVLDFDDPMGWARQPRVLQVFEAMRERHRIAQEYERYTARILWDTLRSPLELPAVDPTGSNATGSTSLDALCNADAFAREVGFRFPIPDGHFPLGQWPDEPPRIERGWVEGTIDLIFEHGGRVFIADWKSNTRPDYRPEILAGYLDNHYALQAQLYTLATVRMLGIGDQAGYDRLFGGCAYFFLRGMRPDGGHRGEGIAWCRPSWQTLQRWDERLRDKPTSLWKKPTPVFTAQLAAGGIR